MPVLSFFAFLKLRYLFLIKNSGKYTEKKQSPSGKDNTLLSGIQWMDNDMVNLASNFFLP